MAELIKKTDTLNQGRVKLNEAITDAETAKVVSEQADDKATQALAQSESTQTQLDTIVIDGDSSVEAAQARVSTTGTVYGTLKQRLDTEYEEVTTQLAQIEKKVKSVSYALFNNFDVNPNFELAKYYNDTDGKYYLDELFTQEYIYDDGVVIKACHDYANENNVPVINASGQYVIKQTRGITVKTDTDLGSSIIHVDEQYNNTTPVFHVLHSNEYQTVPSEIVTVLNNSLRKGVQRIDGIPDYYNCMFLVNEENIVMTRTNGTDIKRQEFFVLEKNGLIVGDINFDLTNISTATFVKLDDKYLSFKGGVFYISGNNSYSGYSAPVVLFERSRLKVNSQTIDIEPNSTDKALTGKHRNGLYGLKNVYDIEMDVRFTPILYTGSGTYGLRIDNAINPRFKGLKSVASYGDDYYFGTIGSNVLKNAVFDDCDLNRIDVHFYASNLTVENSRLSQYGVEVGIGFGRLNIKNCTYNDSNRIFELRSDYAATWEGDILIDGITLNASNDSEYVIPMRAVLSNPHDYKYPTTVGHTIEIKNITINISNEEKRGKIIPLLLAPSLALNNRKYYTTITTSFTGSTLTLPGNVASSFVVGDTVYLTETSATMSNGNLKKVTSVNFDGTNTVIQFDTAITLATIYSVTNFRRSTIAHTINIENIRVNTLNGVAPMGCTYISNIERPDLLKTRKNMSYSTSDGLFEHNASFTIKNCDLRDDSNETVTDTNTINLNVYATHAYQSDSYAPIVYISDCGKVRLCPKGAVSNWFVKNCLIKSVDGFEGGAMRGKMVFDDCQIKGYSLSEESSILLVSETIGTTYNRCRFFPPVINGVERTDKYTLYRLGDLVAASSVPTWASLIDCVISPTLSPSAEIVTKYKLSLV